MKKKGNNNSNNKNKNKKGGGSSNNKGNKDSINPIFHIQQQNKKRDEINVKNNIKNKLKNRNSGGRLEDVDDITLEEYKKSEINTLKRIRNHVYEGGDEFDNFDILGDGDDGEYNPEDYKQQVFTFSEGDVGSLDFMSDEQLFQMKRQLKKQKVIKEEFNDQDDDDDDDEDSNKNATKMSKKEKAKRKLERRLEEAKNIHFQNLAPSNENKAESKGGAEL
eukprot:gene6135-7643_t